jgi:hypothetical protein
MTAMKLRLISQVGIKLVERTELNEKKVQWTSTIATAVL